jgi:hypothetical protein
MGQINKVLVVVGAQRRAEKKYLLGAEWPMSLCTGRPGPACCRPNRRIPHLRVISLLSKTRLVLASPRALADITKDVERSAT